APSANCASASDLASPILPSAARNLRRTTDSSIILAMKMVHVASEARASPIMTALTRISADMNIDQGDNSRSPAVVDLGGLPPPSAGIVAVMPEAAGNGPGTSVDGAACAGIVTGCNWVGACCADDGDASDSTASTDITA